MKKILRHLKKMLGGIGYGHNVMPCTLGYTSARHGLNRAGRRAA